jgi:hypothetical protein
VKWWLLAIPHYVVVGILLGGGGYATSRTDAWGWGLQLGLIGTLVLFAGLALVFVGRYPRGIFDFVLGLDRWVARVASYALLMRDEYPPFRLDQGGTEKGTSVEAPVEPIAQPVTAETPPPGERSGGTAGRVVLIVVGVIAGIVAFALLVGGCALVAVDRTQRDDDGFLMSPSEDFSTATYAVVSESADLDTGGAEWALDTFLGTVRIRSDSDERDVFVGIGSAADVDAYLDGVDHDEVTDLKDKPNYDRVPGGAPPAPPGDQRFWAESASGTGELTVDWEPEDGVWRVVLMNADAARGVSSDMSIGAELDSVLWIGIGMLLAGGLLAAGAALAITAGVRRRA